MKRLLAVLVAPLLLVVATALPASAQSPHFIRANAALQGENLVVSWKEAGLGDNQRIDYTATASADATYVCVNRGGANPSASNKTDVQADVDATGTFDSGRNGQITASLTIEPPDSGLTCPPGQMLRLAEVTYTNVSISDDTNGISESIPGTFSTGCLLPNVRGACA